MLIHPIQVSENYPIGMIIEAYAPPNDNWMLCDGQVLAKASYPALYALMDRPHPIFEHWEEVYADNLDSFGFTSNIVYGNGLWVAANGSDMAYSSDGETWTYVYFPTNSTSLYSLAYNGTIFVCKPYSSLTKYFTSTDGMAWTERNLPIAIKSYFISYDGTYFYLINEDSVNCLYSSNGIDWSTGTSLISASWFTHAASPDVLVVSADNSVNLAVSIDKMTTWKYYAPRQ